MKKRDFMVGLGASAGLASLGGGVNAMNGRYYMPAEDAPHEATFMQFPTSRSTYRDRVFRQMTQQVIIDIANQISDYEPVYLLADGRLHDDLRARVSKAVTLWDIPTDDLWARDSGPIFVQNEAGHLAISHIQFNGWGRRARYRNDERIAERVAAELKLPILSTDLVGEGGGVEQDDQGLLMAHESSWVHDNRNPGMSRDQIEVLLLEALGADRMIWAEGLKDMDVTDYHIDSLARFAPDGSVLINLPSEPIPGEPFHDTALDTYDALEAAGLEVHVLYEPDRPRVQSEDFVRSYMNYYICNGAVISAQFGDRRADAEAAEFLAEFYPGRDIIQMNVDPLGELGGGIHCATQQMPKSA